MSTKSKRTAQAKTHNRSALIQWVAVGMIVGLGLIAALVLSDGGGGNGGHSGAPALSQQY